MPDKGWRKRLQDKRPKTPAPLKPKPVESNAPENDTALSKGIDTDPLPDSDKIGWRKTYHSQPPTPIKALTAASGGDDAEETRSEAGSETTAPRRRSAPRPKFSRYLSDYLSITAASKSPEFSEPWSEERPLTIEPPVDPLVVVQAVRSHIANMASKPISAEHSSGLLRVFEDYGKVREEKERLEGLLGETLEGYRIAEESWSREEGCYQDEIRRLELLIARGTSGMAGLIQARQGSVINRRRVPRKIFSSSGGMETAYEFLTRDQIDEQIKSKSQKVIFHRPSSPSGKMAALSSQFSPTGSSQELRVGTPPIRAPNMSLSRKVKSELDLEKIGQLDSQNTNDPSVCSGFSVSGDRLPDEEEPPATAAIDPGIESEAFVALRELALLVARRRGIDAEKFHNNLVNLYSSAEDASDESIAGNPRLDEISKRRFASVWRFERGNTELSEHNLRRLESRSESLREQSRRRHFSFEPGDDDNFGEKLGKRRFPRPKSPAGSQSTISSESYGSYVDPSSQPSTNGLYARNAETLKPSKIPSPLNGLTRAHVRRENSMSSLQSVRSRLKLDDRRDSQSSVMTAFRQNSSGSLPRPRSTSGSSSYNNSHQEQGQQVKDAPGSLRPQNSVLALAAARTGGKASSSTSESKRSSPVKRGKRQSSARPSIVRTDNVSGRTKSSENEVPRKRS